MVRFKNRYITVEIINEQQQSSNLKKLTSTDLYREILRTVSSLHGDFGIASVRTGLAASYCNEITQIAIIRARHGPHKLITSSLPAITSIAGKSVKINTLYIGATLHQCYKVILKHQKESLAKLLPNVKPEDKLYFEKEVLSISGFFLSNKKEK